VKLNSKYEKAGLFAMNSNLDELKAGNVDKKPHPEILAQERARAQLEQTIGILTKRLENTQQSGKNNQHLLVQETLLLTRY
jgi:hypothetical protein